MVTISKVYTRGGDRGKTSLVGGKRVAKDHIRVEVYGTVDELGSIIGLARSWNSQKRGFKQKKRLETIFGAIQNRLFDLGSELATPRDFKRKTPFVSVGPANIRWLEKTIDSMLKELPPLQSFVLPGGGMLGAFLHHARTVCRRAERLAIRLDRTEPMQKCIIPYLNRLSDLLFVCARWAALKSGEKEILWHPLKQDPGIR